MTSQSSTRNEEKEASKGQTTGDKRKTMVPGDEPKGSGRGVRTGTRGHKGTKPGGRARTQPTQGA